MKDAVFTKNRKASFNFELLKRYEAGIVLDGHEVKSIQGNRVNITGSQIRIKDGRAFLIGADIAPYQAGNMPKAHNPLRDRELLLKKKEILEIAQEVKEHKLTIVPISVYNRRYRIKVGFALGKIKNKSDKRAALKKKDTLRKIKRITG